MKFVALLILLSRYSNIKVDLETKLFIDSTGHHRIFHGVNVAYKSPPYHPSLDTFNEVTSFVEKDA